MTELVVFVRLRLRKQHRARFTQKIPKDKDFRWTREEDYIRLQLAFINKFLIRGKIEFTYN